ncbi:unnamed protein product [Tenebrio molitor]|nr:unnamed protein product [Tenebrio molitor]
MNSAIFQIHSTLLRVYLTKNGTNCFCPERRSLEIYNQRQFLFSARKRFTGYLI